MKRFVLLLLAGMFAGTQASAQSTGQITGLVSDQSGAPLSGVAVNVGTGGLGSLTGAAVASVLVAVLQQFANFYLGGTGDFIVVILLAVVLLVRPAGLLGRKA